MLNRPSKEEYGTYYDRYISLVPEGDVAELLKSQYIEIEDLLASLPEERGSFRYAPGKWSLKEVVGHMADTERVMAYRLLRIARGDQTPLPGFDQDVFVKGASFDSFSLKDLLEDYSAVRRSTLTLLRGVTEEVSLRAGTVGDNPATARSLAYIIAGHEIHHLKVIRERYLG